jgi:hypothetical protein
VADRSKADRVADRSKADRVADRSKADRVADRSKADRVADRSKADRVAVTDLAVAMGRAVVLRDLGALDHKAQGASQGQAAFRLLVVPATILTPAVTEKDRKSNRLPP